jgi:hypothetical protein
MSRYLINNVVDTVRLLDIVSRLLQSYTLRERLIMLDLRWPDSQRHLQ